MIAMEQREISLDGPKVVEAQIEGRIRRKFGPQVAFHHTVCMTRLTYSGLHDTADQAIKAFKSEKSAGIGEKASQNLTSGKAVVKELCVGEEYDEWGRGKYVHGENDGTHGSHRDPYGSAFRNPFRV